MNSDKPKPESAVAVGGNVDDSNIIIGDNNSVTKTAQKRSPLCYYPECEFEAEYKCSSCGKMFCLKHIASVPSASYYGAPKQWLCAKHLKEKANFQKSIAITSTAFGILGFLVIFLSRGDISCLGPLLAVSGFSIGMFTGLNYFSAQSAFRKSFPDQEEVIKN